MEVKNIVDYLEEYVVNPNSDRNKRATCRKLVAYFKKKKSNGNEILEYDIQDFEKIIEYLQPTSVIEISNLIYRINDVIRDYHQIYYGSDWKNYKICMIKKNDLWTRLKDENDLKRYFSEKQYQYIIDYLNKEVLYDDNDLYYKTLFMSIYEGIYDKGLTEIKNLRLSDISSETNVITLRNDDDDERKLEISKELKKNLIKLSKVEVWHKVRSNSSKPIHVPLIGKYEDSIFKIALYSASNIDKAYREFYFRRLKTITKEFIGYPTTPLQIYVSGIINRVYAQMFQYDVTIDDIKNNNRLFTTSAKFFIKKECERVNYSINIYTFMRVLKSYLDIFDENIVTREEIVNKSDKIKENNKRKNNK